MSYKALYNKYRSQTFDELVGQQTIVTTLKNALATNKIAHAYLFCGPRGTGKTSVARLFLFLLNCSEGVGHQCNKCENCIQISEGQHPDVIEIDAASNSGVDEVRSLIEKVKYAPIKGRYKIYIIDEVHMMTPSAFNALLKTLEEPPEYVVFILCTTEPYKLLPTIISRCQRFEFRKISDDELKKLIIRVLTNENVKADLDTVNLIIELANGGARDAMSILDQLIAYSGNTICVKDIEMVFGLTSASEKLNLLKLISENNTLEILKVYDEFIKRNVDIQRLTNELLYILKDSLIYSKIKSANLLTVIDEDKAKAITSVFSETRLLEMIDLLLKCQSEFKTASNPNFLFEIYLLKLVTPTSEQKVVETTSRIDATLAKPIEKNTTIPTVSEIKPIVQPVVEKPKIEPKKEEIKEEPTYSEKDLENLPPLFPANDEKEEEIEKSPIAITGESYNLDRDTLIKIMVLGNKKVREEIIKRWQYFDAFKNDKDLGPFAMLLKDGTPYVVTSNIMIIRFNLENEATRCNIKEHQKKLAKVLEKIVGKTLFVYGINRKVLNVLTHEFINLNQVNKIKKASEIGEIKIDK